MLLCTYSATPTNATTATTAKINGQTTPLDVTGLSQSEIQSLLLSSHPSAAAAVAAQALSVKREPEDLRKEPKSSRSQKVSVITYMSHLKCIETDTYGGKINITDDYDAMQ